MRPRLQKIVDAEIRNLTITRMKIAAGLGGVVGLTFGLITIDDNPFDIPGVQYLGITTVGGVVAGGLTGTLCTGIGLVLLTIDQAFKLKKMHRAINNKY